jgi:hypothetical protein
MLDFQLHGIDNFNEIEKTKFFNALDQARQVINSDDFKSRFLSLNLEQTEGFSNEQIFDMFMSGSDKFNKEADSDIDLKITMYYSIGRAIGYTLPSTFATWINRKFFSGMNIAEIAGNIIHEYFHNLGFDHRRASDHNSVPYAGGYLVRDMIIEKLNLPVKRFKQSPFKRVIGFFRRIF